MFIRQNLLRHIYTDNVMDVKIFSFRFINRAAMNVFTRQTLLKHKYEDNVKGLVFFFCGIYIFLWF